ncbi:hypothetical protein EKL29_21325 [Pantoea sp. YU22]|uniref:hypothetical protein n=1 Tax=Pantoea sp. YU22 TaxID=2497684 RepID=UPI000F887137|nr:hypothetical protein [Pantoea sp. YU22]RTY53662.1 hypothetical protein EKL29_21325 [Pantoea sp. YU22]
MPVAVKRNEQGIFRHPDFYQGDSPEGFKHWCEVAGLEFSVVILEEVRAGDNGWSLPKPLAAEWFIGSIHEAEDWGFVCVWLRRKEASPSSLVSQCDDSETFYRVIKSD